LFTDTHSHIHFAKHFPDIDQVIERALQAKVSHQIIVGCTPQDSLEALEFVKTQEQKGRTHFWSTLGVHPHNANEWTKEIQEKFEELAKKEHKIVALGEMGLDYFRNFQPHDLQKKAFQGQIELAQKLDLPVVVHVRDAWEDAFIILKEVGNRKVILHCFTGTLDQANICWERGYHTSFSGVLTYPKNEYLREVAKKAPDELLLIETDCPYLTPQSRRGQRNEPAFVVETAKVLAQVRNKSLEEVAHQLKQNSFQIFNLKA